jgi:enoyl-CoA hydratase/carnithine racemase
MALARQPLHAAFTTIAKIPKPVVAAVTDFRVCGERTRFGQPEILLGIIPGAGGTQRLPRPIGLARAKHLVYTGRFVDAQEALQIGLVDQVVPDAEVYDTATRLTGAVPCRAGAGPARREAGQRRRRRPRPRRRAQIERLHFSALFGTEDQKLGMNSFIANGPAKARFVGR